MAVGEVEVLRPVVGSDGVLAGSEMVADVGAHRFFWLGLFGGFDAF